MYYYGHQLALNVMPSRDYGGQLALNIAPSLEYMSPELMGTASREYFSAVLLLFSSCEGPQVSATGLFKPPSSRGHNPSNPSNPS